MSDWLLTRVTWHWVSPLSPHTAPCSSQSRGQPGTRGSSLVSATDTHWMGMAGDVPGPVSSARAWALCTEDRMSEGMSSSWPQPVQPAKIAPATRAGAGGGWTNGWPGMARAVQSKCEEELTAGNGAGPVLSFLVSVLWSRCPLDSTCPPLPPLLRVSGQAPCLKLTAQLRAHSSSLLCWFLAPANSASLSLSLSLSLLT